ncbi:MAG: hypothetical protein M1378_00910 [Bacteroidetes bacterium]|nr:hypothetical protein [Bacteroidota bacterium]
MSNEEQEQRLKAARRAWQKDVVALRLDQDTIEDLTRVAKQRKIGISDLVKQFIADGLSREQNPQK